MELDLGVDFDFLISMSVLTFSENTSVLLIGFALSATKLVASVMEARIRIREIANEREHYTV